jgi:hypothetical protein
LACVQDPGTAGTWSTKEDCKAAASLNACGD